MIKTITVLGASGSIGLQVLDTLKSRTDYKLVGISCYNNIEVLKKILGTFSTIKYCYIYDSKKVIDLKKTYKDINFFSGDDGLILMIKEANSDVYENSISGFAGLFPSIEILKLNKILLLANKESLVVGGEFIKELLNSGHGRLIPIDSEHVAISKCLYKNDVKDIDHIVLTASGGQFFDYSREKLSEVSTKVALSNPNWQMGKRITLDSNTMMNKMFEIVEAHYLFDLPLDKIKVLVNKDSYVHSFVVFKDKTILCVGKPTMIDPIIYALNLAIPNNKEDHFTDLEVNTQNQYKFYKVDENRFPSLSLAKVILDNLGDAGCIINALDEEVIKNYLTNKITFKEIDETIIRFARESKYRKVYDIKELKKIDFDTRLMVQDYFDKVRIK